MMTAPNFHGMHPPPHFAMEKCLTEKDDKTMDSPRHDQLAAFKALVSSQLKALVSASSQLKALVSVSFQLKTLVSVSSQLISR